MKKIVYSPLAPEPIGPYSQAVLIKDTLYISGQIALDVKTGELHTASIEDETNQVMENIRAILKAEHMTFANIVKCSIFLKDMGKFDRVNHIYGTYFKENAPARETVEVAKLPKDVNVEISCIAVKN